MLPVTDKNIIKLDLNKECLTKTEEKYTKMLKEQIFWLNRNDDKLYGRAKKLYDKYINGTLNESIAKRCCNFKLLEENNVDTVVVGSYLAKRRTFQKNIDSLRETKKQN